VFSAYSESTFIRPYVDPGNVVLLGVGLQHVSEYKLNVHDYLNVDKSSFLDCRIGIFHFGYGMKQSWGYRRSSCIRTIPVLNAHCISSLLKVLNTVRYLVWN